MAITAKRGLKVNYPIIFIAGILFIIASALVFLLVVRNVYGKYDMSEILPSTENLSVLSLKKQDKAALLYSKYTENMLPAGSTWLRDNISTWETFLQRFNVPYDIIDDQTVETGKHFEYKILILAGSKSLSDKQILNIKKFLENGGSVFSTGGPASYSDEGKWRGWDFFTEAFGIKFNTEIKPEEFYKIHTLRGNLPLTGGIPSGYTLKIATWDRPIYAEILEPRTTQVSFWYDFRREAGLVREGIQKSAGIAYGSYGKGRFIWFGFELNSVIGAQEDFIYFDKLMQNSFNWLTYGPTGYVKDWPAPYEAAAIIVPTITNNIENVYNFKRLIDANRYPVTYFVDPFVAAENPSIIKSISGSAEFGAIVDIGYITSMQDSVNSLYDKDVQTSNLEVAKKKLESVINKEVRGIMPLYGFFNENTMQAMRQAGIDYLITDSLTDRSVPNIIIRGGKPLMIISKTSRDDYEVIKQYGLTNTDFQLYTYEEDIDRIIFEGGLYVFKIHTDYQMRPEYVNVVNDVVKLLRKKNIWLTSIAELQNWWDKRRGIEISYKAVSKRRIIVEVTNPGNLDTDNFTVQIDVNKPVTNIEISSDIINTKIPRYQFDAKNHVLYLFIEDLKEGQSRSFFIDFDNINA
ncbi:MAG: hypothetical protein V1720_07475 [bacterium]